MGDTKRVVLVLARRAESTRVAEFVEERFPSGGTPVILVFDNPDGLNKRDGAAIQDLGEWQRSDEAPELIDPNGIVSIITVSNAAASLVSEDGTTTMVVNCLATRPVTSIWKRSKRSLSGRAIHQKASKSR